MPPIPQWPSEDDGRHLHAELMRGISTAPDVFAGVYYQPLRDYLASASAHVAEELRDSAVSETIMNVIERPQQYNPELLSFTRYLCMSVRGDLRNLCAQDVRRRGREISLGFVDEPTASGNNCVEPVEAPSLDDPRVVDEVASFGPREHVAYTLILAGERHTDVYARALGLDTTRSDVAAVVKRIKDTVKVRLRRAVGGRS
ncbi:hypothetical protein VT84_16750 [Gemmata sp. SH-PL17]|uniref:hypothetical protein n=1 Tax=Gemmata sp. SH-PL17 TaxID=1630693 RepID=UPI0004B2FAD4|nr:hypothetical protein [Gemmata sp. SH-PL17]AMV26050.1 hypothetical protein VT84_16750 [Gemmata sp. SH-PL17]